jgi:hypothetical protein
MSSRSKHSIIVRRIKLAFCVTLSGIHFLQTSTSSSVASIFSSVSICACAPRKSRPHVECVFIPRRIIGIPSTGSAGLIQTIQMYAQGHWAAGILGTIATVGWTVQGLGNAFYYRQVRGSVRRLRSSSITRRLRRYGTTIQLLVIAWTR